MKKIIFYYIYESQIHKQLNKDDNSNEIVRKKY
jgi:hypothetical protein